MANFFGTGANETITPITVSGTVIRVPAFSFPSAAADWIAGGGGNDVLYGGGGADIVFGGTGNDYVYAGLGIETLSGGTGTDWLNTTTFNGDYRVNLVNGLTNWDGESFVQFENLVTGSGDDTLLGTNGNNYLAGNAGNDWAFGYGGADTLVLGAGNDRAYCGTGNDTAYGVSGNDIFYGNDGNDLLFGGAGDDQVYGNDGNDTLSGGAGRDILGGDGGADRFDYNFTSESNAANRDLITSFDFGSDRIDLDGIDAIVGAGNQDFSPIAGIGVGQLSFWEGPGDHTLILGNTVAGGGFELQIEVDDGADTAGDWSTVLHFLL